MAGALTFQGVFSPCESDTVNVVYDLSFPVGQSLSIISCDHSSSFLRRKSGHSTPPVRFIEVGRRAACRVIGDVQFRRHPPPTFYRRVFLRFGQAMSHKWYERLWVGSDPK
ncbi:hypothetical protein EVAR_99017_1 [Eumeta japonica]|uniref:Uncharacterized protein n=1 Tax=Eumeta variegata TaxID=151549 RepID=A0A4C1Y2G2_EUMVA|nr:hypothetical protein EVAR_99017_1 [Eumeta japonica]